MPPENHRTEPMPPPLMHPCSLPLDKTDYYQQKLTSAVAVMLGRLWPKREHRWQFRLKSLFLLFIVAAILLSWWKVNNLAHQKEATVVRSFDKFSGIGALGPVVVYDFAGPDWFRCLSATPVLDNFDRVVALDLRPFGTTDPNELLKPGWHLQYVKPIGDELMSDIAKLSSLQVLCLSRSNVTDFGVRHIAALNCLETLDLGRAKITDQSAATIEQLSNLRMLSLSGTTIGDTTVARLCRLPSLRILDLSGTKITDASLPKLASMKHLECLFLSNTPVTDRGLRHLKTCKELRCLHVRGTKITDASVETLLSLPHLQKLFLGETDITNEGLQRLASIQSLQQIYANRTFIGGEEPKRGQN